MFIRRIFGAPVDGTFVSWQTLHFRRNPVKRRLRLSFAAFAFSLFPQTLPGVLPEFPRLPTFSPLKEPRYGLFCHHLFCSASSPS